MPKKIAHKPKSNVLAQLAKVVRNRRYELTLTQEELAERGNFHVNYIGGIERATRNPSFECLIKLARALEISPKDLMPN